MLGMKVLLNPQEQESVLGFSITQNSLISACADNSFQSSFITQNSLMSACADNSFQNSKHIVMTMYIKQGITNRCFMLWFPFSPFMWQLFFPKAGCCVRWRTRMHKDLDRTNESPNVLGDASCFHGRHLAFPQAVQQSRFPVIHVSQDGDNWGPWGQDCWVCRRSVIAAKIGV